jgi:2-iminobutanoate/2-iminopropanoate deaminase
MSTPAKPEIEYPLKSDTPVSHLPFSPAVCYGDLVFVSGQASVDKDGKYIPDTFEGEFRRSMENLKQILEDAGSSLKHVVQTRNYIGNPEDGAEYNRLYCEYFSAPFPARTTISKCLSRVKYEIECIAVRHHK